MKKFKVLLFYKYVYFAEPDNFMHDHLEWCNDNDIKGRIFIANEGINGTVSGTIETIERYKLLLRNYPEFSDIVFKEDDEDKHAFNKIFVRVKREIVSSNLNSTSIKNGGKRLNPDDLLKFYKEKKDFVIIDTRNWYESKIGKFRNAITPPMKNFREWAQYVELLSDFKNKTVVTYCTGGIRCEKASAYLVENGFTDVYQLEGGIVTYAKKFPDTYWEGGIFVFDERRVVDPNNDPELKYVSKCYYCGEPTSYYINCHNLKCDKILVVCHNCKEENDYCCSVQCRNSPFKRDKYYG